MDVREELPMNNENPSIGLASAISPSLTCFVRLAISAGVLLTILAAASLSQAQTFSVIHSFNGPDGDVPEAALTLDRSGNLYGTTLLGGNMTHTCSAAGCGTVFKMTHSGSGWVLSTLYKFSGGDGESPNTNVFFGSDGSLYGIAGSAGFGGVLFNLRPPLSICKSVSCPWVETAYFPWGSRGGGAFGNLSFDALGNIYGTTESGGDYSYCDGLGCGTVFEITKVAGTWTAETLHNFTNGADGEYPYGGIVEDQAGNLYGTAPQDGAGHGLVFEMTPSGSSWTFNAIYQFRGGDDGEYPWAGVFLDTAGNLNGATKFGGAGQGGTVYQLSPSGGRWNFNLLYGLPEGGTAGGPVATPIMDSAGNIYGTTYRDGVHGYGSVFKLTPSNGGYIYTSLHDFAGGSDGAYPMGSLVIDANGNLYGTASDAGNHGFQCGNGCGVVFEITPN